ncbi:hypothetical protein [uncultured Alistipes sp.]|jgi:hypothetical protein|uniref:hypothetical protein n=1 Tax=uncultured Alistipes sp. TaxID=538949 RepID=UPI0025CD2C12|nr:hypothetical protein [uncultured Alistipes sp.]
MKRKLIALAACLFVVTAAYPQTYWRESVDTVSSAGYYNIELSQQLAGRGLHTLRIRDADDNEIPYLLRSSVPVSEMKQMEMYEILSHTRRDSVNTIVVRNTDAAISRFYLQLKEAEVAKQIAIRGSYDRKQWFSVKQRTPLHSEHNSMLGGIAIVDFPTGDYTYYELTVTNNSRSPLNITGVGKIGKSTIYGQFIELDAGPFETWEEDGNTIVAFPTLDRPFYLSKIEIGAQGKGHFSRRVRVETQGTYRGSFLFSSRELPVFYFDDLQIRDLRLVIENADNPPLSVSSVKLYGLNRYLCAYLEPGVQYRIETGSGNPPHYDIRKFADDIPLNLPVVKTGEPEEVVVAIPERVLEFYEKPFFMWGIIVFSGVVLLWVCAGMLRELKKKQDRKEDVQ